MRERTLPHRGEMNQFVRGRWAAIRAANAILLECLNDRCGSQFSVSRGHRARLESGPTRKSGN
jgi:hypothetical protein